MINWRKKLSSRKFWVALVGFTSAICIAFNVEPGSMERVSAIIMSGASLIAYVLAEGFIDGKTAGLNQEEQSADEDQ